MTALQQSLDATIAQAEEQNNGDGWIAAALSFMYRAQEALAEKDAVENPPAPTPEEAPADGEVQAEA